MNKNPLLGMNKNLIVTTKMVLKIEEVAAQVIGQIKAVDITTEDLKWDSREFELILRLGIVDVS